MYIENNNTLLYLTNKVNRLRVRYSNEPIKLEHLLKRPLLQLELFEDCISIYNKIKRDEKIDLILSDV